ncbi:MAG: hypothetical protein ACREI2_08430 [Nitrospiraceae bacterium]
MIPLLLGQILLIALIAFGQFSWAGEVSETSSHTKALSSAELNLLTPEDRLPALQGLSTRFKENVNVRTSYATQPYSSGRLKELLGKTQDEKAFGFLGSSSFFQGALVGEGEFAHSPPTTSSVAGRGDPRNRLFRISLTGGQGTIRYGFSNRTAGKEFLNTPDQDMKEVWGEWSRGIARFRSSVAKSHNNVDEDPLQSRLTQLLGKTSVTVAPPSWPEIGLSYSRGSSSSSLEPIGVMSQRTIWDSVDASLSFSRPTWNARISSSFSSNIDLLRPSGETIGLAHAVSGSYRLTNSLTFNPTVSLRRDRQQWSGVHINTPSTSLAVTYKTDDSFKFTATGTYTESQSSDGLVDTSTITATSIVSWIPGASAQKGPSFSLETHYSTTRQETAPSLDTEDLTALLLMQLTYF